MYLFLPTGEREYEATNSVSSCLLLFTWYWKRREYYYYSDKWQLNKHFLHEHEQCFRSWCWCHMWVIEFVVLLLLLSLLLVLFFAPRGFSPLIKNRHFQIPIQSGKHCQTRFKNKFIRTPTCFMGLNRLQFTIVFITRYIYVLHISSHALVIKHPLNIFFISQPTVKSRWLISFLKPEKCYVCGYYC